MKAKLFMIGLILGTIVSVITFPSCNFIKSSDEATDVDSVTIKVDTVQVDTVTVKTDSVISL